MGDACYRNHALGLATRETRVIETMRWDWLHRSLVFIEYIN